MTPGVDKYVFFLDENEEREIRANYREFLELLGIWEHLEIINTPRLTGRLSSRSWGCTAAVAIRPSS